MIYGKDELMLVFSLAKIKLTLYNFFIEFKG
jgi:hypothetical protein